MFLYALLFHLFIKLNTSLSQSHFVAITKTVNLIIEPNEYRMDETPPTFYEISTSLFS